MKRGIGRVRNGARVSRKQSVARRAIPLSGIALVLGILGCGRISFYSYSVDEAAHAQNESAPAKHELVSVVEIFLKDVPKNERSTFDRFFADDIIYTRGTGQVVTKKDILADAGNTTVPRANATFTGEDYQVHQYGDMAIVNFRLVMHATENDKSVTHTFRNTATFMKRNGVWQAVAWQATPIAEKK
ncbi:MAG TPA: nuclear transport factor 2 family protein [Terriglobales bacterium]|nr:nuclear transport factor 2 family protein [Terriglobales bacterium]